jgi:hypothetical protein
VGGISKYEVQAAGTTIEMTTSHIAAHVAYESLSCRDKTLFQYLGNGNKIVLRFYKRA